MIDHYFMSARRKFVQTPVTTALNILALALGFACFIAAMGVSRYWAISDAQFSASDRIHVVSTNYGGRDQAANSTGFGLNTPRPAGLYLREEFPQLEAVARMTNAGEFPVETSDRRVRLTGARAEADLLKIFDFDFIAGDPLGALDSPDGAVITRSAAQSLFGDGDPLGQTVRLGEDRSLQITGVIEDIQAPSHMADTPGAMGQFDFLFGWSEDLEEEWWLGTAGRTYLLFPQDGSFTPSALSAQFDAFLQRRVPENQSSVVDIQFGLVPLSGIQARLLDLMLFEGASSALLSVTNILAGLGIVVLIVACVNYANLATAQAANRVREVGMRKALGAGRGEVLVQYWFEAFLLTLLAAILTLVLTWLAAPIVERATLVDLRTSLFSEPWPLLLITGLIVAVSFLASLYPVAILSRVRPVDAIRAGTIRTGPKLAMKVLIASQFAIASGLLISLIAINAQNAHLRQSGLGQTSPIAFLTDREVRDIGYTTLQDALADEPSIEAISQLNYTPWTDYSNWLDGTVSPDGTGPIVNMFASSVGYDFFEVFDGTLLAGRTFDPERDGRDPEAEESNRDGSAEAPFVLRVVIDRPVSDWLGYESPDAAVGQVFYLSEALTQSFGNAITFEIIGVVESMPLVFSTRGRPWHVYTLGDEGQGRPVVRFAEGRLEEGMARLREEIRARDPQALVNMRFYEDIFEDGFQTFGAINAAFLGLSIITFAVSMIGLVAMAVFVAGRRRHEIGVRKTLGASTLEVMGLLLRDFTVPVLIGNLIAWPVAWIVARTYIGNFVEQVALSPLPWVLGLAVTLTIAWIAVGGQAWRAARVKPALVLRHE